MRKTMISMLVSALACSPLGAHAAGMMKQGLWEMTVKSDAMKSRPALTPQQQEMMRQRGISVPQMQDGAMQNKFCVSKEMAERDSPPAMRQNQTGCETKNFTRSAGGYSADLVCNGPNMQGSGTIKGTFSGNESFASTYDFKGTAHGHPINTHQETSGKWLSADCGSIKPPPVPK